MSQKYALKVIHNGADYGDFCIFQTNDQQSEDIKSLAWFCKSAHPNTNLYFKWTLDYGFTWSETGQLIPGVIFESSQHKPADPSDVSQNTIELSKQRGAFKFSPSDNSIDQGKLGIFFDHNIPLDTVSVGIAMSGKTVFACMALPNFKFTFTPRPRYWLIFGEYEEGEVIDLNHITPKYEIKYPINSYDCTIELQPDNTFKQIK